MQPIVENAIKHGILKRLEGGKLTICTYEIADSFVVEVADNGVGFCTENIDLNNNLHIGISNIKYRIENACNGKLEIKSETDKGTNVKIMFPKRG